MVSVETLPLKETGDKTSASTRNGAERPALRGPAVLVFISGFAGLVLQVAWFREFALVFGATTAASAAVLAIFMGGLGIGNAVLGPRADHHPHPLQLFAQLLLLVALTAALSGYLIDASRAFYIYLGGQSVLGLTGATLVRLLLASLVLALPTIFMGGTLPAVVKAVTTDDDRHRRYAAVLYGVNTLGAVIGAMAATFMFLATLGTRATLWAACGLYLVTALAGFWLSRKPGVPSAALRKAPSQNQHLESRLSRTSFVYMAAAITGFTFFLMELVWYRMLGPILGGTTYTFGLILVVALFGIGVGGAIYPWLIRRLHVSLSLLAACYSLQAMCMAIPFALGDQVALWAAELHNVGGGFFATVMGWSVIASVVVLPAAIVGGFQFPLLIGLAGTGDDEIGTQLGRAFAANTAGAILGSLAGGFGLLPLLTAPGAWRLAIVLLVFLAVFAFSLAWRRGQRGIVHLVSLTTLIVIALSLARTGPTAVWRHSGIGAGRFHLPSRDSVEMKDWTNSRRRAVLWEAEGTEASTAILAEDGLAFWINGKSDGHAVADAGTQIMLGLLGAALCPNPKTALVVGLGTGETPGWLAETATIERVDVVELEPAIAEMARRCAAVNHDAMEHPKVRLVYNDAREVLLTSPDSYYLIVSEPSNPYRAGIASLFTSEFYEASIGRLNQGGLFIQWLQGYEVDTTTVATTLATLRSVFPHVEIWQSKAEDMLLVCSMEPIEIEAQVLISRIETEPLRSALRHAWRVTDLEGFLARFVAGSKTVDEMARCSEARVNTDDLNTIEYGFARTLGRNATGFSITDLRMQAYADNSHRPCLRTGEVKWDRVEDHRQMILALAQGRVVVPPEASAEQAARTEALGRYWAGDAKGMIEAWQSVQYEPLYPTETCLLALACAHVGDDRICHFIEKVREFDSVEARAIESLYEFHKGNLGAAAERLESVFVALRENPWCMPHVLELIFPAAVQVVAQKPDESARLYGALGQPFAVYLYEEQRLAAAHAIAAMIGPEAVLETLRAYEPFVPWNERFLESRYRVYEACGDPLRLAHVVIGRACAVTDAMISPIRFLLVVFAALPLDICGCSLPRRGLCVPRFRPLLLSPFSLSAWRMALWTPAAVESL